jgi:ankyrin repeat protein
MNRDNRKLIHAAMKNNLMEVRRLLSFGADVNATNGPVGWTALHLASLFGHVQVVNELREHGADIEAKDSDGNTPLFLACGRQNHPVVVKALLAVGADCRAINNIGEHPIGEAIVYGKSEIAKYLLQNFYATTRRLPLHVLLEDLTWIGDPNCGSAPPLREALHRNVLGTDDVVEILEYLVGQNHELISSVDQDGSLPLHVACRRGAAFPIVPSLVNLYKVSVKSVTSEGDLPIFLACEIPEPSLDTIFILIKLYPELLLDRKVFLSQERILLAKSREECKQLIAENAELRSELSAQNKKLANIARLLENQ